MSNCRQEVKINNYDFSKCTIKSVDIYPASRRSLGTMKIARSDGDKLISDSYDSKQIQISGTLKSLSLGDIINDLDEMKRECSVRQGNWDIDFGSLRRYIATTTEVIPKVTQPLSIYTPFTIVGLAMDPPFAFEIDELGGEIISEIIYTALSVSGDFIEG